MKPYFPIVLLSLVSLNVHAQVHKWVDTDGNVHYSDTLPAEVTEVQSVRNIAGKGQTETPASNAPKSYAEREAEMKRSKQAKIDESLKKDQQEVTDTTKNRNCEAARQSARTLEEGARIVTYDANGERTFMDDDARAQKLEEARKAISDNCN